MIIGQRTDSLQYVQLKHIEFLQFGDKENQNYQFFGGPKEMSRQRNNRVAICQRKRRKQTLNFILTPQLK